MKIRLKKEYKSVVTTPEAIATILQDILKAEDEIERNKEHFWRLDLNIRNIINTIDLVSLGTLTASLVHPREVFRRAIANGTAQIIIAHNHPSEITDPSEDDIRITRRIEEAGKILGIELLDHIIVSADSYCSFKEKGIF